MQASGYFDSEKGHFYILKDSLLAQNVEREYKKSASGMARNRIIAAACTYTGGFYKVNKDTKCRSASAAACYVLGKDFSYIEWEDADFKVYAYDFRLYLPDGIEVDTKANGSFNFTLKERNANHSTNVQKTSDGAIQFGVNSPTLYLTGESGPVLGIVLKASAELAEGSYQATIERITYANKEAQTDVPENTLFINGNKFYYSDGTIKMKGYRAYFDFYDVITKIEGGSGVKMFFDSDDEEDGIKGIDQEIRTKDDIYDLSGRKISQRLQQGIYIVNGKKIIVK